MLKHEALQPIHRILILAVILVGFGLRLYHLDSTSLWLDELMQLDIAQGPVSEIWPKLERHAAMPLDYDLLHGWLKLGRQESWVRFPAVIFGLITIPLIFALGRNLFGSRTGLIAAVLLAVASFAIRYSQEVRPYALLMMLTMLSWLALWLAYRTGRERYWWIAILAFLSAVLSHYFMLFMLVPLGLFVAGYQLRNLKRSLVWEHTAHFILLTGLLFCLFFFIGRVPRLYGVGTRFMQDLRQPETLTLPAEAKPNKGSGPQVGLSFLAQQVFPALNTTTVGPSVVYIFFALVAGLSLFWINNQQRAALGLTLAWTICPIVLIYLFLLQRGAFFAARYILYTLPAYLLLVAWGIDRLAQQFARFRSQRSSGLAAAMITVLGLIMLISAEAVELRTYYTRPAYEDWRAVGQLLQANAGPDDAVIAVLAEPTLNWYYPPAAALHGTYGRSEAIWNAMTGHPRRWFILSTYSTKRDEGLLDWLTEQGAVTIAIDRRVTVYLQQEGLSKSQLLAEVATFTLPPKAGTYAGLADQFSQAGLFDTAQHYYQQAIDLAESEVQRVDYQTRLAQLP